MSTLFILSIHCSYNVLYTVYTLNVYYTPYLTVYTCLYCSHCTIYNIPIHVHTQRNLLLFCTSGLTLTPFRSLCILVIINHNK